MARVANPQYLVRRVVYTREEFQVIKTNGNTLTYSNPESNGSAEIYLRRSVGHESMNVLETLRLLTRAEAGLMELPFEGVEDAAKEESFTSSAHI